MTTHVHPDGPRPVWQGLDGLRGNHAVALQDDTRLGVPPTTSRDLLALRVLQIASGLHSAGVRRGELVTFNWPPVGTYKWPPVGTFSWPRTKAIGSWLRPNELSTWRSPASTGRPSIHGPSTGVLLLDAIRPVSATSRFTMRGGPAQRCWWIWKSTSR